MIRDDVAEQVEVEGKARQQAGQPRSAGQPMRKWVIGLM
jgi:hypothetical protein